MNRERFLVKSFGDNIEGTRAGLVKLLQLLETYDHAVIVVPQIREVKSTMLANVFDESTLEALVKYGEINFLGGKKISLCAQATLKNYENADAYLVLWGSEYAINDIEALYRWKAVVFVTWLSNDSAKWEVDNRVSVIYDSKKANH